MDINLIKQLIKIVEKSEITEFSVHEGDLKLKISKATNQQTTVTYAGMQEMRPAMQVHNPTEAPASSPNLPPKENESSNYYEIKSPIVGTFYRAPAPDADPYIQVGDIVSPGSVLCIVEAMKLMNEIECDVSGKVVKILLENASPVEYNQPIFLIEKS
ncbi:MAG: acetyl-CoA carboxylase biotin carboxyl carrier protein [Ignavibacteriaceae bacterium]|jgi:acetyl-CoA carboxylase biotin carboxyl carrier protein|nr:acetyl-CoA carboxylase biotin carboxyl carrier protein [Ignavibacteriaceae bacterium]